jgi:hypothetical protein
MITEVYGLLRPVCGLLGFVSMEIPGGLYLIFLFLALLFFIALAVRQRLKRRAGQFGYGGALEYLRATPRNEAEKCAAIDLAMIGVVLCLLGIGFFPLVLIGVFPTYFGFRKLLRTGVGIGRSLPPPGPAL